MKRLEKEACVASLTKTCQNHSCVILVKQSGLDAGLTHELRKTARDQNIEVKVVKNTLARLSIENKKFYSFFKGPTALIMGPDMSVATKFVANFSNKREDKFQVLCALIDGNFYDQKAIFQFSTLPSLPEMRAKLLCTLKAPSTALVCLIKEVMTCFVRTLNEKNKK